MGSGRVALGLALLSAALLLFVLSDAPARLLVVEDADEPVDAAVVMAGDPDYERTATAARLVRAGQARLLLLTGGQSGPGDSAVSLRQRAIALGVDPQAIRLEEVSRSTREAVLALRPLLEREGARRVALVTSPYHERRATLAARRAWPGVEVRSRPARPSSWSPLGWWRRPRSRRLVLAEYMKLAYYGIRGWL
jgi:uncharacterized SAM-binding protein YcdF (DUF218 family)